VTGGRAAAVEVSVGTGSGACDTALGVAADVDLGDRSGEGRRGRSTLCGADLHCRWGSRLAGRRGAGEVLQARSGVTVVNGSATPSILAACRKVLDGCSLFS
jgi:hypothetical protein